MRYILNDSGYIQAVSFNNLLECQNKTCTEYTGTVPTGYESLAIWSENANINAYKIVNGNLVFDSGEDARLQSLWASQEVNSGTSLNEVINLLFPVGKVEVFFDNADHSNYLGFTWERTSIGKVPIGINTSDADFNTIGKTGGSKSNAYNFSHTHTTGNHTLTINEMPVHNHEELYGQNAWVDQNGYGETKYGNAVVYESSITSKANLTKNTGGGQSHNHGNTGSALGNTSISTIQPYEVMAFWKRIS